jgi:hypothetical protein
MHADGVVERVGCGTTLTRQERRSLLMWRLLSTCKAVKHGEANGAMRLMVQ